MARPLRIEFPHAVYHVTSRGDGREDIYASDADRLLFLELLAQTIHRFHWRCHAYCLMDNHFHLLIETPEANLSRGMRHLNGVYTQKFNRRHGRVGHVFQGRFKAIVVQKDAHLLELCRYVVLNPVRAGMRRRVGDWPWSSYRATVGIRSRPEWLTVDWALGQMGLRRGAAVRAYRRFVAEGVGRKPWEELVGQIYWGDEEFIEGLRGDRKAREVPRVQRQPLRPSLAELLRRGTPREAYRAHVTHGYRLHEIAAHVRRHYTTVSRWIKDYEGRQMHERKT